VRALLAVLLFAGLLGAAPCEAREPGHAWQDGLQVQVLHDSRMQIALCNATTAIRVIAQPLERDSTESMLNPDLRMDIERMTLRPDGSIERSNASIRLGYIQCMDDYIAVYAVGAHVWLYLNHWPRDAAAPAELGSGDKLDMAGPGIVFVPSYPFTTVNEMRERLPDPRFLFVPPGLEDWPESSVRAGTSSTGAPLLLATLRSFYGNMVGIAVIETGRDPVAGHRAELKIDGVPDQLQAAALSTWGARPALRFAYRIPSNDFTSLVVGAASCDPPRALSDDVVTCRPLARMRVPSHVDGTEQVKEAERALIAIAEQGTRAFVLTTDSRSWCLRISPLDSSSVSAPSACVLEMLGAATGLAAVSDREVLLLVTEGEKVPTYRLLRVRGLEEIGVVPQTSPPEPDPARPNTSIKNRVGGPARSR
jgi:hypothetical protein